MFLPQAAVYSEGKLTSVFNENLDENKIRSKRDMKACPPAVKRNGTYHFRVVTVVASSKDIGQIKEHNRAFSIGAAVPVSQSQRHSSVHGLRHRHVGEAEIERQHPLYVRTDAKRNVRRFFNDDERTDRSYGNARRDCALRKTEKKMRRKTKKNICVFLFLLFCLESRFGCGSDRDHGQSSEVRRFHEAVDGLRARAPDVEAPSVASELFRLHESLLVLHVAPHSRLRRNRQRRFARLSAHCSATRAKGTRRKSRRHYSSSSAKILRFVLVLLHDRHAAGAGRCPVSSGENSHWTLVLLRSHHRCDVYGEFGRFSHRSTSAGPNLVRRRTRRASSDALRHRRELGRSKFL